MGERTYKQLNWTSRIKLETMLKHGHSKKEIAEELGVHISTVYRELKRGTYEHLNSDYTTEERYSPEKAEARYQEGLAAKGAPLKIGKNHAAAQFIEDKIGNEDYIRIKDGRAETVVAALDRLERLYGAAFYRIFKSITVDNGSEFADADGIERSDRRKDAKRTTVYYCHAYSSYERGTNENINRMIRRQFPKGTDFDKVTAAEVKRVETWLNNYPREILGFMSSAEAFEIAFDRAA